MSEVIQVDVRGLSCPEPVLRTRQAMQRPDATKIEVLADSVASRDNVKRTAEAEGWDVLVKQLAYGEFELDLTK